jgi:hypothetical protein
LASHLDKAEMIQKNPERAAMLAAKAAGANGYDVSAEVFKRVFKRIDFSIDIDEKVLMGIQDTAQFLFDQKSINKIPGIKFDKSFLDEAKILRKSK